MFRSLMASATILVALGGACAAETFDVRMLNSGEEGRMVFEPSALRIALGDTVRFVAADKGHNAESVDGMMPDGAEAFAGKINEEIEITPSQPGFYGVMCKPHFAMGMVMTIAVGDAAEAPAAFLEGRMPPNAKKRFQSQASNF